MTKTSKIIISVIIAIIIIGGIWYGLTRQPKEEEVIKIGAILPLTGEAAFWGQNAYNGITLAVEEINKKGGINGRKLEVIFEDGQCDSKTTVTAMQKLVNIDKVFVVIGEVCSSATLSIAPIAQNNKVVLITPCSESPEITKIGDFIFRTWTPNNRQAKTIAKYARESLEFEKIAILSINNDYGESLSKVFSEEFQSLGGLIVAHEKYDQKERDFRVFLTKIKSVNPEAIYLISYQPDGMAAIKQINELKIKAKILGTSGINSIDDFFKPLGNLAEGIIFADLEDDTTPEFRQHYSQIYKKEWPGVGSCASVAYDCVILLAEAIEEVGSDTEKIKEFLYSLKDFPGVSGPITFDENGDLDRNYSIFIVENGRPKIIEE